MNINRYLKPHKILKSIFNHFSRRSKRAKVVIVASGMMLALIPFNPANTLTNLATDISQVTQQPIMQDIGQAVSSKLKIFSIVLNAVSGLTNIANNVYHKGLEIVGNIPILNLLVGTSSNEIPKLTQKLMAARDQYSKAVPYQLDNIISIAKERRAKLLAEASSDPSQFLKHSTLIHQRSSFPTRAQSLIEQEASISGELQSSHTHLGNAENQTATYYYFLKTPDKNYYRMNFVNNPPSAASGSKVIAHGILLGGEIVMHKAIPFADAKKLLSKKVPSKKVLGVQSINAPATANEYTLTTTSGPDVLNTPKTATTTTQDQKVLIIKYFPLDGTGQNIDKDLTGNGDSLSYVRGWTDQQDQALMTALTNGTKYHGYSNPSAIPALNYVQSEVKEFDKAAPVDTTNESGFGSSTIDYVAVLSNDINICDYVDNKGVKEVWIWSYQSNNLGMLEWLTVPGSNRANQTIHLPMSMIVSTAQNTVCQNTYFVNTYNYNTYRGTDAMMHSHSHMLEGLLDMIDTNTWYNLYVETYGRSDVVNACGNVHYPPNTTAEYIYNSSSEAYSNCPNWNPDGSGITTATSCHTWIGVGQNCDNNNGEVEYLTWWMQGIPGIGNTVNYQGKTLPNFWDYLSNFDTVVGDVAGGGYLNGEVAIVDAPTTRLSSSVTGAAGTTATITPGTNITLTVYGQDGSYQAGYVTSVEIDAYSFNDQTVTPLPCNTPQSNNYTCQITWIAPTTPGTYRIDTKATSTLGQSCSSNPNDLESGYTDCGLTSSITFTVTTEIPAPVPTYQISGYVYKDLNNNGVHDLGESVYNDAPVVVSVTGGPSQVNYVLSTNNAGYYSRNPLLPGTYTVKMTTPYGTTSTASTSQDITIVNSSITQNFYVIPVKTIVSDSLNRINNSQSLGNTDIGQAWIATNGTWGISNNQAYISNNGTGDDYAVVDSGISDGTVQATLVVNTQDARIIFRYVDANNYYFVENTGLAYRLKKMVGGVITELKYDFTKPVNNDMISMTFNGSSITVSINGIQRMSATDSSLLTGTKHGIGSYSGANINTVRFDDFSVSLSPYAAVYDSFNKANNTTSLGSAISGQQWIVTNGTWGISNNQAYISNNGTGDDYAIVDSGISDGTVQATLAVNAQDARVVFRYFDDYNMYYVQNKGDSYRLYKVVDENVTQLGSYYTTSWANGDVIRIDFSGPTITVYINDTARISYTDSSPLNGIGHGVGIYNGANVQTVRFDNFSVVSTSPVTVESQNIAKPLTAGSLIRNSELQKRRSILKTRRSNNIHPTPNPTLTLPTKQTTNQLTYPNSSPSASLTPATTLAPIPSQKSPVPQVKKIASCIDPNTSQNIVEISWAQVVPHVISIDISDNDPNFTEFYFKPVPKEITFFGAPNNFYGYNGSIRGKPLLLNPNHKYYVRTFNEFSHSTKDGAIPVLFGFKPCTPTP